MNLRLSCGSELEREVVRLWRCNHLTRGSTHAYLQWVRRFLVYCQHHHFDETSQLTLDGATRFTQRYVGPRKKGPIAAKTRAVALAALHGWACGLRVLKIGVPQWRPRRAPERLTRLLAAYGQYRRSQCGVAERTLRRDLETAQTFLSLLRRGGRSARRATIADLDAFVAQQSQRVSTRTVADSCSSLRSFLRFLRVTDRLRHDLAASVMAPRLRFAVRPPRALPWADVRRILRSISSAHPPGKRDFAMLLMMATYGFGAAEVLGLHLEDVDWKANILCVRRAKTGALIELPLLPPIAQALASYLRGERPTNRQVRRIFLSTKMPYEPLTSGAIRHRIRHYAHQAGIDVHVIGAHVFRHSHATRQIDAGANPKVLSDILGHRRPSSTSVYVRVALRRLRTVALPVPQ